ncbi:hypothetical protein [Streptomyces noursei]|uniref:hypothetical protein n=1 Tax=Streptomyces noursei TaxID=1971 RepID=UPI001963B5E9|nr:hypothetical protein [Streptomyces noursei]QRX95546.1 hypothetical protein JNO44_36400 [Streptomyces noursei]
MAKWAYVIVMHFGHGKSSAKGVGSKYSYGSPEAARRAMLQELHELSAEYQDPATAQRLGDVEAVGSQGPVVLAQHSGRVYRPRGKGRQQVPVPVQNPDGAAEPVTVTVAAPVGPSGGSNSPGRLLIGLGVLFLGAAAITMAVDWGQVGAVLGALVTGAIGAACLVSGIRELR